MAEKGRLDAAVGHALPLSAAATQLGFHNRETQTETVSAGSAQ